MTLNQIKIKFDKFFGTGFWEKEYKPHITVFAEQCVRESEEQFQNSHAPFVNKWVSVKDAMPDHCDQVFVKYENGRYGVNEWFESDNSWKYNFANMIVKEWCNPPCS